MTHNIEIWKPVIIDGKKTDYEVSNLAVVRRLSDSSTLKQSMSHSTYKGVTRYTNTVRIKIGDESRQIHVKLLVARAHVPNQDPEKFNTVVYINGNVDYASNLKWASRSEVIASAMKEVKKGKEHGRFGMKASEKTKKLMKLAHKGKSKYNGKVICEGRKFNTKTDAAKFFKVSVKTVSDRIKSENKEWRAWFIKGESKLKPISQ